jgi:hypothetical protein
MISRLAQRTACPAPPWDDLTAKLVGTLREQKVPAVGFVNAGKLFKCGEA